MSTATPVYVTFSAAIPLGNYTDRWTTTRPAGQWTAGQDPLGNDPPDNEYSASSPYGALSGCHHDRLSKYYLAASLIPAANGSAENEPRVIGALGGQYT